MMMNILCTGIILLASTAFASMRSKQPPTSYPDLYTPAIHECGVQNLTIEAKLELNQQNFPNKLKDIEMKLLIGFPISKLERTAWRSMSKMVSDKNADANCETFFEKMDGLMGRCCRVRMGDKPFAFCTYDHLLMVPRNGNYYSNGKTKNGHEDPFLHMHTTDRMWSITDPLRGFQGSLNPVSIYVDLFAVPCDSAEFGSLCTQYCCDETRKDSDFCESRLECF